MITSNDGTGQGIHVLRAKETSNWYNVTVSNLTTLSYEEWHLTGGVTFYESPIEMREVVFHQCHSEDGLNIIKTTFQLEEVTIENTLSDGLDIDFGAGTIVRSTFNETGNDGLDVSGSKIDISDCKFIRTGDKGFSVGEQSTATATSCEFFMCATGVASKDRSTLDVHGSKFEECDVPVMAYQKKPEFGGSVANLHDSSFKDNKKACISDTRSTIEFASSPQSIDLVEKVEW